MNSVTALVANNVDILLLVLSGLPHLNLHTASDDGHSHGREQVVCGVGVSVHTSVEDGGTVLAHSAHDESLSTRVVLNKGGDIVDDSGDEHEVTGLSLLLELLKLDDGKLLNGNTPVEGVSPLVELLLSLLHETLLNGVLRESLQVPGEADLLERPDEPLGGVVLVPDESVSVVGGELVVEVVVALAKGNECGEHVVSGGSSVVKGLLSDPVGQRVNTEGNLLHESVSHDSSVHKTTLPVAPAKAADKHGENNAHKGQDPDVVSVLHSHDPVVVEVGNVGSALVLGVGHEQHPAKVREPESLSGVVGVLVGVSEPVVGSVSGSPPSDRALNGSATHEGEDESHGESGLVSSVGPESVVAGSDAKAGAHVVEDGKGGGLVVEGHEGSGGERRQRQREHKDHVEPVDVLVPVLEREGLLGNVPTLGVVHVSGHLDRRVVLDLVVDVSSGGDGVDLVDIDFSNVFDHV